MEQAGASRCFCGYTPRASSHWTGCEHILVEIAASVGRTIQTRLERKRRLYEESTGVSPARVILAAASIHSRRAHDLRQMGIEVIEPEEIDGP